VSADRPLELAAPDPRRRRRGVRCAWSSSHDEQGRYALARAARARLQSPELPAPRRRNSPTCEVIVNRRGIDPGCARAKLMRRSSRRSAIRPLPPPPPPPPPAAPTVARVVRNDRTSATPAIDVSVTRGDRLVRKIDAKYQPLRLDVDRIARGRYPARHTRSASRARCSVRSGSPRKVHRLVGEAG